MATIDVAEHEVRIRLRPLEKLFAVHGDLAVPRSSVTSVQVFAEGLDAVKGFRAPGLNVPGRISIGTWRRRRGKELVVARAGQPAVRLELSGQPFAAVVVGTDDPTAIEAALA